MATAEIPRPSPPKRKKKTKLIHENNSLLEFESTVLVAFLLSEFSLDLIFRLCHQ